MPCEDRDVQAQDLSPGRDAALGLAMAKVLIDEGRCAADLLREQTDLPSPVRRRDRKLLCESDIVRGGSSETFYLPVAGAYERPNVVVMNSTVTVPFVHATEKAVEGVVESSSNLGDVTWPEVKANGIAPFPAPGNFWLSWGQAADIDPTHEDTPKPATIRS